MELRMLIRRTLVPSVAAAALVVVPAATTTATPPADPGLVTSPGVVVLVSPPSAGGDGGGPAGGTGGVYPYGYPTPPSTPRPGSCSAARCCSCSTPPPVSTLWSRYSRSGCPAKPIATLYADGPPDPDHWVRIWPWTTGWHTATLSVTTAAGCVDTTTHTFLVLEEPPRVELPEVGLPEIPSAYPVTELEPADLAEAARQLRAIIEALPPTTARDRATRTADRRRCGGARDAHVQRRGYGSTPSAVTLMTMESRDMARSITSSRCSASTWTANGWRHLR